ncbi:MAG: BMP family ABC transporter substrate-binding protein [Spirochaetae bacterium HGW-Spirochaetae-7]|nr:MAG: BMP family ABC transporter substrate-binding protein [Spirochaetae bacterium HGW-Spirochaetae-7]
MKKILAVLFAALIILSSCAKKEAPATATEAPKLKVVLLLNGTLGDKSFFDSAANGMSLVQAEMGAAVETKTIEMGYDQSKWEPTLLDVSEGPWDIVVLGTWQMTEALQKVAKDHPTKKYVIFDTAVDYTLGLANVYSILYSQNEASFLAGALATYVTTSSMPLANKQKVIGFLGGMDIPVINDFLVGYIEGAQYVDPAVKVSISYIGSFDDSAKGKEMALAQYAQGADIGYNVAGQAGLGQLDAAKDAKRYAIGVDSDQAAIFATSDPEKAKLITTSVLKRVDNSILRAVQMHVKGTAPYGNAETLGFAENCVGLAKNDIYNQVVPAEIRTKLDELERKIIAKEIKVGTAFSMTTEDLNKIRNAVKQ